MTPVAALWHPRVGHAPPLGGNRAAWRPRGRAGALVDDPRHQSMVHDQNFSSRTCLWGNHA